MFLLEDYAEAEQYLSQAILLNPLHPKAHIMRGHALAKLGRLEEAIASYDKALAVKPDHGDAQSTRGLRDFLVKVIRQHEPAEQAGE